MEAKINATQNKWKITGFPEIEIKEKIVIPLTESEYEEMIRNQKIEFLNAEQNIVKELKLYFKEFPKINCKLHIDIFEKMINVQKLCEVEEVKSCINYFTIVSLKKKLLNFIKYHNETLFNVFNIPLLESEICILIELVNNTTQQQNIQNKLDDLRLSEPTIISYTKTYTNIITSYKKYLIRFPNDEYLKDLIHKICVNYELYYNYNNETPKIEYEQKLNKLAEQLNNLCLSEILLVKSLNQLTKVSNDNIIIKNKNLHDNYLTLIQEGIKINSSFQKIQNLIKFQSQQIASIKNSINKYVKQLRPDTIAKIKNDCSKNDCDICFETKNTYSFYNCNHVICSNCYFNIEHAYIKEHVCPFCRSSVKVKNVTPDEFYIN